MEELIICLMPLLASLTFAWYVISDHRSRRNERWYYNIDMEYLSGNYEKIKHLFKSGEREEIEPILMRHRQRGKERLLNHKPMMCVPRIFIKPYDKESI